MNRIGLVFRRDLLDLRRQLAFKVVTVILLVVCPGLVALSFSLAFITEQDIAAAGGLSLPGLFGMLCLFATMFPYLSYIWVFSGSLLAGEKEGGRLETILATPLSVRGLFLGKSLALVLPGVILSLVTGMLVFGASFAAMAAGAKPFLSVPLALTCLVGNFFLLAGLGALTLVVALRAGSETAIAPSFAIGFGLMAGIPAGLALGIFDLSGWLFFTVYLALALVEWGCVFLAVRKLDKEKIILAGRND